MTIPHNGNGHRRRELRKRVLREESTCALCDKPVDKTLHYLDPQAPVVDEDLPRSRGGSPYDRNNCHLMHRECNRWKSAMTLQEARDKLQGTPTKHTPPRPRPSAGW